MYQKDIKEDCFYVGRRTGRRRHVLWIDGSTVRWADCFGPGECEKSAFAQWAEFEVPDFTAEEIAIAEKNGRCI